MSNLKKASAAQLYPDFPWVAARDQRTVQLIYKQAKACYRGVSLKKIWSLIYIEPETVIDVTQYKDNKNLTLSPFEHSSPGPRTVHLQILFLWGSFGQYQRHYSSQTASRWRIFLFFWSLFCLEHWPKRGAGLGRSRTVSHFFFNAQFKMFVSLVC